MNLVWDKVFKNEPSKIHGRQLLKIFTRSILEYFVPEEVMRYLTHYVKSAQIRTFIIMLQFLHNPDIKIFDPASP